MVVQQAVDGFPTEKVVEKIGKRRTDGNVVRDKVVKVAEPH